MKFILLTAILILITIKIFSQQVGSKVSLQDNTGKKYTGVIKDIQNGKYYVRYDGYDFSAWLARDQFTFFKVENNNQDTRTTTNDSKTSRIPEMNGALPKLPGTAWLLVSIIPKGKIPEYLTSYLPYLFSTNGRWETQFIGRTDMGSYQVQGNKLVQMRDGIENIKWVSTLKWNAAGNYLDLEQSDVIYRLHYSSKTSR